ncbi:MAG: tRNA (guanine-N7)-methyltransferase [Deinococcota bacterium]
MSSDNLQLIPSAQTHTIDPGLTFVNYQQYLFPIDWDNSFIQTGKLHVEVGFGDGRYTAFRAGEAPDERFVGVELSGASIARARKRLAREDIHNVKLLKVTAQLALQHLFAEASLSSITVNFPDPWPKDRHEQNRLLRVPFFELAATRLVPGGEIRLATDHPDYLAQAQTEAAQTDLYDLVTRPAPEAVFATKYALKWKAQGKPLHYQVFTRTDTALATALTQYYPILQRKHVMAHAVLTGSLPPDLKFSKVVTDYADGHVILHEITRSLQEVKLLVRATINEPSLRQQVLVSVRQKEPQTNSEIIVALEAFGDPLITETSKGAVHATCQWLLSQSDELSIKERCY